MQSHPRSLSNNPRIAGVPVFIFPRITNSPRTILLALLKDVLEICFIISAPQAAFILSGLLQNSTWVAGRVLHRGIFMRHNFTWEVSFTPSGTEWVTLWWTELITHLLHLTIGIHISEDHFAVSLFSWWCKNSASLFAFSAGTVWAGAGKYLQL